MTVGLHIEIEHMVSVELLLWLWFRYCAGLWLRLDIVMVGLYVNRRVMVLV